MVYSLYLKPAVFNGKVVRKYNDVDMLKVWTKGDYEGETLSKKDISHLKLLINKLSFGLCPWLSKEERLFEQGLSHYREQIDIVNLLRNVREVKAVVKQLIMSQEKFHLD